MKEINLIKEHFGSDVKLKELIYDTDVSKVYGITIDGMECVLKIKECSQSEDTQPRELKNILKNMGVPLSETLFSSGGITVDRRIQGINLGKYDRHIEESEGDSLRRESKGLSINNNLVKITTSIAKRLREFHVNIKDIDPRLYNQRSLSDQVRHSYDDPFEYSHIGEEYKNKIVEIREYIAKEKQNIDFDKLGVTHGDLHNMGNIMVIKDMDVVFIDYESISLGEQGYDVAQLFRNIIKKDIYREIFIENYTKGMSKEDIKYLERSISLYWVEDIVHEMGNINSSLRIKYDFQNTYNTIIIKQEPMIKLINN